ncbi:structural maintenance of chromosomes protein 2-2 [Trichonephila clavipes]|nr:structural maintenance of chromosomes protein 2-2 [Trichonephila clavipes]
MTLADCRRPLFACRMIYRSSPAVVVLGRPPPTFLTAVPVVWNAFQAREMTLLLIPNSTATLVTVCPSSSFSIILQRVKSSRAVGRFKVTSIKFRCLDGHKCQQKWSLGCRTNSLQVVLSPRRSAKSTIEQWHLHRLLLGIKRMTTPLFARNLPAVAGRGISRQGQQISGRDWNLRPEFSRVCRSSRL